MDSFLLKCYNTAKSKTALKSFIILYTGNVGSSPLLNALKISPQAYIRLYENLDKRIWQKVTQGQSITSPLFKEIFKFYLHPTSQSCDELLRLFASYDHVSFPKAIRVCAERLKDLDKPALSGFKWRPWEPIGIPLDFFTNLYSSLSVVPIVPLRQNLISALIRPYFNNSYARKYFQIENTTHLQFHFTEKKMSDVVYEAHLELMRSHKFLLEDNDFNSILQEAKSYLRQTRRTLKYLSNFDAKPLYVSTEKITKNPCHQANKILDVFGVDRVPVDSSLLFRKAGMFSDDQVENIDQLLSHPGISSEASLYS